MNKHLPTWGQICSLAAGKCVQIWILSALSTLLCTFCSLMWSGLVGMHINSILKCLNSRIWVIYGICKRKYGASLMGKQRRQLKLIVDRFFVRQLLLVMYAVDLSVVSSLSDEWAHVVLHNYLKVKNEAITRNIHGLIHICNTNIALMRYLFLK